MAFFGHHAAARRYARARPSVHPLVVGRIERTVAPGPPIGRALDVGCGTGQSAVAPRAIATEGVGLDVSPAMLAVAPRAPGLRYVVGAAERLPVVSRAFGPVTVALAFHWLDRDRFLPEARRVRSPSGWLVLDDNAFAGTMREDPSFHQPTPGGRPGRRGRRRPGRGGRGGGARRRRPGSAARPSRSRRRRAAATRPVFEQIEDTVGRHDTLIPARDPKRYEQIGEPGHPNRREALVSALAPYGIANDRLPDPINWFMHVAIGPAGALELREPLSTAGDHVVLRARIDAVVAVSACPHAKNPTDGFAPSDLLVQLSR